MKKIIFISLLSSLVFLVAGYLCCYANTLELDYKITEIKTRISSLEDENNKLKEIVSIVKDPNQVKK
ncbi:MAG: hypothetical protein PHO23_01990 [Candidatus Pacebacteria bacterium]|nr:hypothetical protein [Candidatus Paceibacterota bacterium]